MNIFHHDWTKIIEGWPETSKSTAKEIADKYGPPDSVCSAGLIWENKGGYAWIQVHAKEVEHDFPIVHKDVLDIAIPYKVPVDKLVKLAEFDGSAEVLRTKGIVVAGCFKEGLDLLILNLVNDKVTEKTDPMQARMTFGKVAMGMMKGEKHPYTEGFNSNCSP
ncbi:MAG: hypothetical protein ACYCXB_07360 [Candidatus Humimicrobiaceae bacterium]